MGIWHPEGPALANIRQLIADKPKDWLKAIGSKPFKSTFELHGDSLVRPPKGFDKAHPQIGHLKRKDFIGLKNLTQKQVTDKNFIDEFAEMCKAGSPLMKFLCKALGVKF